MSFFRGAPPIRVTRSEIPAGHSGGNITLEERPPFLSREYQMAHKKVERKKELDRRRHRREQRLKQRIHEAKAAKA